jgi:hypothetical protein
MRFPPLKPPNHSFVSIGSTVLEAAEPHLRDGFSNESQEPRTAFQDRGLLPKYQVLALASIQPPPNIHNRDNHCFNTFDLSQALTLIGDLLHLTIIIYKCCLSDFEKFTLYRHIQDMQSERVGHELLSTPGFELCWYWRNIFD